MAAPWQSSCLMHQMWSSCCLLLTLLMQSRRKSPSLPTVLSPLVTQQFYQMEATSTMHQLPRLIPMSVTKCMWTFKTSTKISPIWLPHVNAIRGAQQHTACVHGMDIRSVALATPSLFLLTARNDGMVNSFNPVQLSAWHANVDMQYILSRRRVIEYCTNYVTKNTFTVTEGSLHHHSPQFQGRQQLPQGSAETSHQQRRRERLLGSRNLPSPSAAANVQGLT